MVPTAKRYLELKQVREFLDSKQLAKKIARLTLEKKAEDVVILNLKSLTTVTDYFVICSGLSNTQVRAISDHVSDELKKVKQRPHHIEISPKQEWVLLDFIDVILHIFQPQKRDFYGLERLWGDAEIEEVVDS